MSEDKVTLDELIDAFKVYIDKCKEFEKKLGIHICVPSGIQLAETGKSSPFKVCSLADIEPDYQGKNSSYYSFGIIYEDVDIHWLVG